MSYKTEATVYPTFVAFVVATVEEVTLSSWVTTALQMVDMDDMSLIELPIEEYVAHALKHSDFESMSRDSIEMVLLEQGKKALYGANHTTVIVYDLPE